MFTVIDIHDKRKVFLRVLVSATFIVYSDLYWEADKPNFATLCGVLTIHAA